MTEAILEARTVHKSFRQGPVTLEVLQGINIQVHTGERIAIVGSSGSGKTTLLQILGGLDQPTTGHVLIDGQDIHEQSEQERGALRNRALGFVYQFHHLLPEFSALENVAMPLLVRRMKVSEAKERSRRAVGPGRIGSTSESPARSTLRRRAPTRRRGACPGDRAEDRVGR